MKLNAKFGPVGRVEAWLFTIFLFMGLIAWAIFEFSYVGRFYPNVYIGANYIGGRTFQEVFEEVEKANELLSTNGVSVAIKNKAGLHAIQIPRFARGLTTDSVVEYFSINDWQGVLLEAYAFGRSGSVLNKFWDHALSQILPQNYKLPVDLQESAVNSLLDRELDEILNKPIQAKFVNAQGGVKITAEKTGEQIDRKLLLNQLRESLEGFDTKTASLEAVPALPTITSKALQPFLENAKKIKKDMTLRLTYNGYRWNISGATLVGWLIPKKAGKNMELGVDPLALKNFLNKTVAPEIQNPPQNSRFAMSDGKLTEIVAGKSGDSINFSETEKEIDKLIKTIAPGLPAVVGVSIIPVPIIVGKPTITKSTIDKYEIKELVAVAQTNMKGSSADRRHNIKNGISRLNGLLIAPGEEFSAVRSIGTTTEENGFVKEFVIKEEKSVKELGGGLCQVSTTLFRLALNAGLPVTERQAHRYVVSYYGPGLDATIYGPYPDLRFINDTGHYLLLQGRVDSDSVVFEFYGQKDKRSKFISAPVLSDEKPAPETKYVVSQDLPAGAEQCSETPRKGVTAKVTYKVAYPSGEIKEQVFKSVYQPWQKICLIGAKPPRTASN